jgi:hypothetical protein
MFIVVLIILITGNRKMTIEVMHISRTITQLKMDQTPLYLLLLLLAYKHFLYRFIINILMIVFR